MIQRVYERAKLAKRADRVIVATDDVRIIKAVEGFGGEARMTRSEHRTGTERVAKWRRMKEGDVFVNVQGDEPLLDPNAMMWRSIPLLEEPVASISTVATPIKTPATSWTPMVVKVVLTSTRMRFIFRVRRSPGCGYGEQNRGAASETSWTICFSARCAAGISNTAAGELERIEQLEQLRWMENGWKIRVAEVEHERRKRGRAGGRGTS